jgi:hypothetical protein
VPTRRSAAWLRPTRSISASERCFTSRRGTACSAAWSCISSRPLISGSSAASWSATPIARRTSEASRTTSCPATVALPPVGRSSVVSMRTLVVFPAPFGPRNA